jgi:hypothetical protein
LSGDEWILEPGKFIPVINNIQKCKARLQERACTERRSPVSGGLFAPTF